MVFNVVRNVFLTSGFVTAQLTVLMAQTKKIVSISLCNQLKIVILIIYVIFFFTGPDGYLSQSCLPEHGWFSCQNKGAKKCMPISRACDGFADCDDRSDEGGLCSKH